MINNSGVLMTKCPNYNVFIMDIEGTDSAIHAESGQVYNESQ